MGMYEMTLLLMALVGAVNAQTYVVEQGGWVLAKDCSGWKHDASVLQTLFQAADSVRICFNESTDCVQSNPNSFPILNLRQGYGTVSHIDGAVPCNPQCVTQNWVGTNDQYRTLWTTCTPGNVRAQLLNQSTYHSCNNAAGIHWLAGGNQCSVYGRTGSQGHLRLYVNNFMGTSSPSPSPTASPTYFWMDPTHIQTTAELQTIAAALASRVDELERRLNDVPNRTYVEGAISDLNNRAIVAEEIATALAAADETLSQNITLVNNTLNFVVQSLVSAMRHHDGADRPSTANINYDGSAMDLTITAPDGIHLRSATCDVRDLCSAATFAAELKQAVSQALNHH